jgi:[lysine-biosynthesis-protein LysW]--L-2-aminoadipate ligase
VTIPSPGVLLSATMLRPDEKLLLEALRGRRVPVRLALLEDLTPLLSGREKLPEVAIIRNLSHRDASGVARRLEQLGVATLNRSSAIELCNDKGLQALLFARHGIPHPQSQHAFTHAQVRQATAEVGWPAVVKPVSGSWGRGVTRLTDHHCMEAWIGGRESADAAGKFFPVVVQEYVDKPGHDLRVVVVGSDPIVAIRRVSDEWRTNTHLGAGVQRIELTDELYDLCARVVEQLGEGFYGIDIVEDASTGELKVLELNANPEFAGSSARHGVDVAGHVAEYLSRRLHTRAPLAA